MELSGLELHYILLPGDPHMLAVLKLSSLHFMMFVVFLDNRGSKKECPFGGPSFRKGKKSLLEWQTSFHC